MNEDHGDIKVELVVECLEVWSLGPGVFSEVKVFIVGFWLRHAVLETGTDERVLAE